MASRYLSALSVLCILAGTMHAEPVPQWRLEEKDQLRVEWRRLTNASGLRMGSRFMSQQEITVLFQVTVRAVRPDGSMVLEQKIESIKNETRGARADLLPGILEGATFQVTVDRNLNVTRVEGADPIVKRIAGAEVSPRTAVLRAAVEDTARGWLQDVFFPLPDRAAAAGHSWEQRTETYLPGFGRVVRNKSFTLDGPATLAGKPLTRIKVRAEQRLVPPEHEETSLAIKHPKATLHKAEYRGTLHFDARAGRLEESETRCVMRASTSFELQGRTFESDGDQDDITSVRILPAAPAAAPPPPDPVADADLPKELASSVGMKLVLIPRGKFVMGSPTTEEDRSDLEDAHEVEITRPFYLARHEVTIGQYRQFVRATGYRTASERSGLGCTGYNMKTQQKEHSTAYSWQNPGWEHSDEHPVVNLSWYDARAFCDWLSKKEGKPYRLPTEAEWEYACRAGTTTCYHSGDDPETLVKVGNVTDASIKKLFPAWKAIRGDDGYAFTAPVGHFKPNAWGLYDMHGNALEWVADWAWRYDTTTRQDPKGPPAGTGRVQRGGSWADFPYQCRSASRTSAQPEAWFVSSGFRVALSADAAVQPARPAKGDPDAVIAKAVKAMGGAEKLAGTESLLFKSKARLHYPGRILTFQRTVASRGTTCFREEIEVDQGGTTLRTLRIVNGEKTVCKVQDQVRKEGALIRDADRINRHVDHLITLLPLLRGEVKVGWGGEAEVNGRKAVALDVKAAGLPDVRLFFDRETGLVCKLERYSGAAGSEGDLLDVLYDDYREAGGIKYAARRTHRSGGVTVAEYEITEYTPGAVHAADTFMVPPPDSE